MSVPLVSYTCYIANRGESLARPATCIRCGVVISDAEKDHAHVTFSEIADMAYWQCGECAVLFRRELDAAPW